MHFPSTRPCLTLLPILGALAAAAALPPDARAQAPAPVLASAARAAAPAVPEAEAAELRFEEFFRLPIGPLGLELSEKLKSLDGKRVRITGLMVNHVHANPRVFLLSPVALRFHQCEYGLCDDLPANALHVHVPGNPRERIAWTPGELVLTGRLSVGNQEELDGRVSAVRLFLDPAVAASLRAAPAIPAAPTAAR